MQSMKSVFFGAMIMATLIGLYSAATKADDEGGCGTYEFESAFKDREVREELGSIIEDALEGCSIAKKYGSSEELGFSC